MKTNEPVHMYEVYEEGDSILPALTLSNPCNVRIEIKDDYVVLHVGQRDWQWNRKTGIADWMRHHVRPSGCR